MTDYINNFSLPYPEGGDSVAVHSDVEALAKQADTELGAHIDEQGSRLNQLDENVNTLTYRRTPPSDVTVDEMRHRSYTGSYRVLSDAADQLNLPVVDHGILTVTHISGSADQGHVIQTWETRGGYRWDRYILAGTDREWASWRSRQREAENAIDGLGSELATVKTDIQDHDTEITNVKSRVSTHDTEISATKGRVTSVENLTVDQANELVQVEGRLNTHGLWLARNEDAVHDVETQIGGIADGVQDATTSASQAHQSATSAWQANTELIPRVEHIETMAGLEPGEVTDAQTANLIAQPATDTRNALEASYASRSSVIQHVKNFGAVGDGVTDDTAAVQAAVDAGIPLYWGGPADRYRLTGRLFRSTTTPTHWVSDGATIFNDAPEVIQYFVHIEQQGHPINIQGTLHIDANRKSHSCLYLVNNSETHVDATLLDVSVANAYRSSSQYTGGEGIHLRGAYRNITIERPRVVNIGMALGAVVAGEQGVTGISVTAFNYLKAPQKVTILDPYIDGVYDEDTTSNIDQDGIKVFAAEDRDGVLTPYESSFNIIGGHIRNCGGRAIKAQMEWGSVSNLKIYRGQDRTQGGPDIDFQVGGGKVTDLEAQYEGNAPSAVINFSGPATAGKMVPLGSVNGLKVITMGEQTPESLITLNQRQAVESKVTVRDVEILGNQPQAVLRMNGVSGGVHDAAISDVFAAPAISLVRGGFGSPDGWTGNVMASNCLNTGSVPKPLYTSISGGLAAPAISRSNCPKYT